MVVLIMDRTSLGYDSKFESFKIFIFALWCFFLSIIVSSVCHKHFNKYIHIVIVKRMF